MPPRDAIMSQWLIEHHPPSLLADEAARPVPARTSFNRLETVAFAPIRSRVGPRCDARLRLEQIEAMSVTRLIPPHPIRPAGR